ncbi:expressed unknown protein [Seminavis robusta]|uniref:Uncharacterized protein n=1 Tax=Seminavis robusta TaxID=568900 RepID=A0A9N8EJ40_9STRA|nr:expressed unknown protein [Seminavis robusta]|eukprot:Sro1322_g262620.1 n/a (288) ;mRNA; r:29751-30614
MPDTHLGIDNAADVPKPGEILPMTWQGKNLSRNCFRLGMPLELVPELLSYANHMGITGFYRDLVIDGNPLAAGGERVMEFGEDSHQWMVQRPKSHWCSNMHWVSPALESAHDDYLRVLGAGGFDQVLEAVGNYFELEALSAYHLSFIGVSHCEKGYVHADVSGSGRKAFNIIIPLMLESDADPELEILGDEGEEDATQHFYKYRINAASMVGDDALHATAACDYRPQGQMRLAATVYVGDITPENVDELLTSLTQAYPPPGDASHLLERAGQHWSRSDSSKRLPLPT